MSFKDLTKKAAVALRSKPATTSAKKPDNESAEAHTKQPAQKSSSS